MRINSATILSVKIAWSCASKKLVPMARRIQNGGNNCFGPMAGAGYLSVQVIQQFVPVWVIHCAGNRPENTVIS